jgi:trehalose synthase
MLQCVDVGRQNLDGYRTSAGDDAVDRLRELARPLAGLRVLHVSATPYGGGVAEILRSKIPLLRDLGLHADWRLISGDESFFEVTKRIHNGLQGAREGLSTDDEGRYLRQSEHNARLLDHEYDIVMIHDPQPLALRELHGATGARWVWRCHIDTSEPNVDVWAFLRPLLTRYDAAVFTLGGFVPPDFPIGHVDIIPPAIDPQSPKNLELGHPLATRVLEWIGVETDRPLITQISRFDPWKDPLGVIAAYRLVREEVPDVQLALVGSMALDDPEGWDIYRQIQDAAADDPEVHLFTNLTGVGNVEVNAFQRLAQVVIQKSLREGFGLVVSEALWKGTPVVAGAAGGIPLQLQDGHGGYLVHSVEECAARTLELLRDPEQRRAMGESGRERVRERFLLTRLITDELLLYGQLSGAQVADRSGVMPTPTAGIGPSNAERDPVCGITVDRRTSRHLRVDHHDMYFCSTACEDEFARDPERFLRAAPAPAHGHSPRALLRRLRRH